MTTILFTNNWFGSYLTDRKQYVSVFGNDSGYQEIKHDENLSMDKHKENDSNKKTEKN